jgi:hypothetical protein
LSQDKEGEEDEVDSEEENIDEGDDENDYDDSADNIVKDEQKEVGDKSLRRWVKAYVVCFNMDKATVKHAIETASDKFGVNKVSKKDVLKLFLTEEL